MLIFSASDLAYPILLAASVALSFGFLLYSLNCIFLMRASRRYKMPKLEAKENESDSKPTVAIQLPIYNEKYVLSRLVGSCVAAAEAYGREKVRIMILDDSDDDTTVESQEIAERFRKVGYNVEAIHRGRREGFKAGALQCGLDFTTEDFVAIFDSDFVPGPDFLNKTIPYLQQDDKLGIVQTKWAHINRDYNSITRAVSLGMDAHFLIEQTGRYSANCFLNFNGSGGVIRVSALKEAGGWRSDTLAEDLDASYRIQLKGYKVLFLRDVEAPAEVPPTITSFKRQQNRWASGSLQTAKKTLPSILRSRELSLTQKGEAILHLTYYLVNPLMFLAFVLAVIAAFFQIVPGGSEESWSRLYSAFMAGSLNGVISSARSWFATYPAQALMLIVGVASISAVWSYYFVVLRMQRMSIGGNLKNIFVLGLVGYGISASNTIVAFKAILSKKSGVFKRTPKYAIVKGSDDWRSKRYQVPLDFSFLLEIASAITGIAAIYFAYEFKVFGLIPLLMPYAVGYLYVGFLTARQSRAEG